MNPSLTWPRGITTPRGFRAAGGAFGIKKSGLPDLALIVADRPCSAAGVFTTNKLPSPPVVIGKRHLSATKGHAQAVVCVSGNANAATGKGGLDDAQQMCRSVADRVPGLEGGYRTAIPSSTGVIGHRLPMDKIQAGIEALAKQLTRGPVANEAAARAIMTTDLVPKGAYRRLKIGGKTAHLAGICKGSGMIAPSMATMLAFLTTDVAIAPSQLQLALKQAVAVSFNRISVDQHTSPSDTVLILASGASGAKPLSKKSRDLDAFTDALTDLCADLAYQIVADGEGATKVFRVRVIGAKSQRDADRAAKAVVDSPLVKAAVHGGDPNWGRIVTAAGYSGAAIRPEKMSLHIAPAPGNSPGKRDSSSKKDKGKRGVFLGVGVCVYDQGHPLDLSDAQRQQLDQCMTGREIVFELHLGAGKYTTEWLGCDLSKQYVAINAEYTT